MGYEWEGQEGAREMKEQKYSNISLSPYAPEFQGFLETELLNVA